MNGMMRALKILKFLLKKNHKKIVSLDHIIKIVNPNRIQNLINIFVEKTLKTIRFFK